MIRRQQPSRVQRAIQHRGTLPYPRNVGADRFGAPVVFTVHPERCKCNGCK